MFDRNFEQNSTATTLYTLKFLNDKCFFVLLTIIVALDVFNRNRVIFALNYFLALKGLTNCFRENLGLGKSCKVG